ncbi:hypothetical protein T439DRAFT_221758 [Meredithblackwellia eburnea MCA 4105]
MPAPPVPTTSLSERIARLNLQSSSSSTSSPPHQSSNSNPPTTGAQTKISDKINKFQLGAKGEAPLIPRGSFGLAGAGTRSVSSGSTGAGGERAERDSSKDRKVSLGGGRAAVPITNVVAGELSGRRSATPTSTPDKGRSREASERGDESPAPASPLSPQIEAPTPTSTNTSSTTSTDIDTVPPPSGTASTSEPSEDALASSSPSSPSLSHPPTISLSGNSTPTSISSLHVEPPSTPLPILQTPTLISPTPELMSRTGSFVGSDKAEMGDSKAPSLNGDSSPSLSIQSNGGPMEDELSQPIIDATSVFATPSPLPNLPLRGPLSSLRNEGLGLPKSLSSASVNSMIVETGSVAVSSDGEGEGDGEGTPTKELESPLDLTSSTTAGVEKAQDSPSSLQTPLVKCSDCGSSVSLMDLADHTCAEQMVRSPSLSGSIHSHSQSASTSSPLLSARSPSLQSPHVFQQSQSQSPKSAGLTRSFSSTSSSSSGSLSSLANNPTTSRFASRLDEYQSSSAGRSPRRERLDTYVAHTKELVPEDVVGDLDDSEHGAGGGGGGYDLDDLVGGREEDDHPVDVLDLDVPHDDHGHHEEVVGNEMESPMEDVDVGFDEEDLKGHSDLFSSGILPPPPAPAPVPAEVVPPTPTSPPASIPASSAPTSPQQTRIQPQKKKSLIPGRYTDDFDSDDEDGYEGGSVTIVRSTARM